ncbi:MAG: hypothetical protein RLY71_3259 [Pseudomonadota bacterium]|jgi:hypothetical protein
MATTSKAGATGQAAACANQAPQAARTRAGDSLLTASGQLTALLHLITGDGFDNLKTYNEAIQGNVLNLACDLAGQIEEMAWKVVHTQAGGDSLLTASGQLTALLYLITGDGFDNLKTYNEAIQGNVLNLACDLAGQIEERACRIVLGGVPPEAGSAQPSAEPRGGRDGHA